MESLQSLPFNNHLNIRTLGGRLPFLRYIVPFYTSYKERSIEDICDRLVSDGKWKVLSRSEMVPSHEEDLYDFFYKNLSPNNSEGTNLGLCLKADGSFYQKMFYHYVKQKERMTKEFAITDKGMVLFRNGVSFYWYDVKIDFEDPDELVLFQNRFKELNTVRFTTNEDNQFHFTPRLKENGHIFTMGSQIASELESIFSQVDYFPSRINEGFCAEKLRDLQQDWKQKLEGFRAASDNYKSLPEFKEAEKAYNEEKKRWQNVSVETAADLQKETKQPVIVPDRALLYSYIVFNAENSIDDSDNARAEEEKQYLINEMCKYAYYLSRGYKDSYRVTKDAHQEKSQMFFRHENDIWEASLEGCGCYVLVYDRLYDKDQKLRSNTFYDFTRVNEMKGDYFIMLIHLLYQYYTITRYSEEISGFLRQNPEHYLNYSDKTEELYEQILEYKVRMDVFFSSCMFRTISHTTDMGVIYRYIEEKMQIQKNIASIRMGLTNLENLERSVMDKIESQRREKMDNALSVTGFFIGLITLILGYDDIVGFARKIVNFFGFSNVAFYIIAILLFVVIFALEGYAVFNIIRYHRQKKS